MQTFFHLYVDTNENQAKWTLSCFIDTHSKKTRRQLFTQCCNCKVIQFNRNSVHYIKWMDSDDAGNYNCRAQFLQWAKVFGSKSELMTEKAAFFISYQRSPAVPDQKLFMLEVVSGRAGLLQIIVNFTNYFPKSYKKNLFIRK